MKYIFPIVWVGGFGFGTLGLWWNAFRAHNGWLPTSVEPWTFLIGWIAGTTFIISSSLRLKRVQIDHQAFYISNYISEVMVPFTEALDFVASQWSRPATITIHFRTQTAAGSRVVFMPKTGLLSTNLRPVVDELRTLCEKARMSEQQ